MTEMSERPESRAECGCFITMGTLHPCPRHYEKQLQLQANESVGDSWLDLANYAIFGWMFCFNVDFSNDKTFFEGYETALEALRQVTQDRRKKYGAGNLLVHRERGLIVRIADKLSRLTHHFFPPASV
jgi:hypothetical protein